MIKKLYSVDIESDDDKNKDKESENITRMRSNARTQKEYKNEKIGEAITNRSIFSYGYSRLWCLDKFSKPWCCCCRVRTKRADFLYREAKKKLYSEIDLLEIVKQLRVNSFASDIVLKPRQR